MTGTFFIVSFLLATAFGFAYFSNAEFTRTHEAEIVQLALLGAAALMALYAIFSQSFLLFCVEFAGVALGLGAGKLVSRMLAKYGHHLGTDIFC